MLQGCKAAETKVPKQNAYKECFENKWFSKQNKTTH
jgi:hypothetical protein